MDFKLDASHFVAVIVALFGAGGGFWVWLAAKAKGRTDLITVAQDAASKLVADQSAEITRLRDQYDRLEKRFDELEGAHVALGEANRALLATNESLSRQNADLTAQLSAAHARTEQVTQELRQHKQLLAGSTEPRVIEVLEQRAQAAADKPAGTGD